MKATMQTVREFLAVRHKCADGVGHLSKYRRARYEHDLLLLAQFLQHADKVTIEEKTK